MSESGRNGRYDRRNGRQCQMERIAAGAEDGTRERKTEPARTGTGPEGPRRRSAPDGSAPRFSPSRTEPSGSSARLEGPGGNAPEAFGEQRLAVEGAPRLGGERRGREDRPRREGGDGRVHVDADARDHRGAPGGAELRLAEDAGAFAEADEDVVRPLEPGLEPGRGADRLRDGDAAGEGRERERLRRDARPQHDGEVERDPGRRRPRVPRAPAPRGLLLRHDARPRRSARAREPHRLVVGRRQGPESEDRHGGLPLVGLAHAADSIPTAPPFQSEASARAAEFDRSRVE